MALLPCWPPRRSSAATRSWAACVAQRRPWRPSGAWVRSSWSSCRSWRSWRRRIMMTEGSLPRGGR
eukprot:15817694-Heterocapsa_arctica.AAC.1